MFAVSQRLWWLLLVAGSCLTCSVSRADLWCTAYLNGYDLRPSGSVMYASNVDYTAVSHIIHFAVIPNTDGTLDGSINGITPGQSTEIVTRTHAAGKKVIMGLGGNTSLANFESSTSSTYLGAFITNIVNFVSTYGYDGVDIDWEFPTSSDQTQFTNFVVKLRTALKAQNPQSLLTMAAQPYQTAPALIASVQNQFDQINIMDYDLANSRSSAIQMTWFNAPITDGGTLLPNGKSPPSADGMVSLCIAAGIPAGKLGIGIEFYAYIWGGGAGTSTGGAALPRQTWTTAPSSKGNYSFDSIMSGYYQSNYWRWDTNAGATYLSIDNSGSSTDKFISFEDGYACQAKISYARNRGLGGVMIFDLEGGYRPSQPAGQQDPLMQAVKHALATPGAMSIQPSGQDIIVSFTGIPLGSYRIQWATNLNPVVWNTLTITNVPAAGGVLQVTDPGALNQPRRYYRVKTPP